MASPNSTRSDLIITSSANLTASQRDATILVTASLSTLSFFLSFALFLVFFTFRRFYPHLTKRVTLRLVAVTSVVDMAYALAQLGSFLVDQRYCSWATFTYVFLTLFGVFLRCAIAFNLCLVYLLEYKGFSTYERWYYLIPLILTLVASIPPLVAEKYGWWNGEGGFCWFVDPYTRENILWRVLSFQLWVGLGVLYNGSVILFVLVKLRLQSKAIESQTAKEKVLSQTQKSRQYYLDLYRNRQRIQSEEEEAISQRREEVKQISYIVKNIILYPAITIFTQPLSLLADYLSYYYAGSAWLFWLIFTAYLTVSLQGTLNLIAFYFDPNIQRILLEVQFDSIDWVERIERRAAEGGLRLSWKSRWKRWWVYFLYKQRIREYKMQKLLASSALDGAGHSESSDSESSFQLQMTPIEPLHLPKWEPDSILGKITEEDEGGANAHHLKAPRSRSRKGSTASSSAAAFRPPSSSSTREVKLPPPQLIKPSRASYSSIRVTESNSSMTMLPNMSTSMMPTTMGFGGDKNLMLPPRSPRPSSERTVKSEKSSVTSLLDLDVLKDF